MKQGGREKGASAAKSAVRPITRFRVDPPSFLSSSFQDEILDTLFWLRVVIALVAGVAAGAGGRTGAPVFWLHLAASVVVGLAWARGAGVDDDDVGGVGVLVMEGLAQGIACFTLAWIVLHTQSVAAKGG